MKKYSTPLPSIDSAVDSWDSCNPALSSCTNHLKHEFYGLSTFIYLCQIFYVFHHIKMFSFTPILTPFSLLPYLKYYFYSLLYLPPPFPFLTLLFPCLRLHIFFRHKINTQSVPSWGAVLCFAGQSNEIKNTNNLMSRFSIQYGFFENLIQ